MMKIRECWYDLSVTKKLISLILCSIVVLCAVNLVTAYFIVSSGVNKLAVDESRTHSDYVQSYLDRLTARVAPAAAVTSQQRELIVAMNGGKTEVGLYLLSALSRELQGLVSEFLV